MKKIICLFLLAHAVYNATAQTIINRDPQIMQLVNAVSADSLRAYVEGLVSFGTRHTLSSTTDAKRGIGAARNWVVKKIPGICKTQQWPHDGLCGYGNAAA